MSLNSEVVDVQEVARFSRTLGDSSTDRKRIQANNDAVSIHRDQLDPPGSDSDIVM
jgi:hypothetical protein